MTHRFKVGDKVKLKRDSMWLCPSSSGAGTVGSGARSEMPKIHWGGYSLWIQIEDLEYASIVYAEDHLKEKDVL